MPGETPLKKQVMRSAVDVYVLLALITLFFVLSFRVLSPFVMVLVWAAILAVALFPLFASLAQKLGDRKGLAATILALIGLIILFFPAVFVVESAVDTVAPLASALHDGNVELPPANPSVKDWPLIGERIFRLWNQASSDLGQVLKHFAPQLKDLAAFVLNMGTAMAAGLLQFALSVIFAAVILAYAQPLSQLCYRLAARLADDKGRELVDMAGATVRNVSKGILGVAVIQGGLAAIGIIVVGMPFAPFIGALAIASSIVQVPFLVLIPVIIYVWTAEPTVTALIFTAYMVPVLISDNFLKPILMARGLETPMIVILIGVIGGTVAAGLLGLFMGPVILAVFYQMVVYWTATPDDPPTADSKEKADEAS